MKPFILIEGADGSGKSVLANALAERGWPVEHAGSPTKYPFNFYMEKLLPYPDGGVVFDRFHPGSFVYGNAFRSLDGMSPFEYWQLEGLLLAYNSFLIYCRPPDAVMDEDLAKGPEDEDAEIYEVPDKQEQVRQLYDIFVGSRTYLPYVTYDYTDGEAFDEILKAIDEMVEYFSTVPMPFASFLGNGHAPEICFAGKFQAKEYFHRTMVASQIQLNAVCLVDTIPAGFRATHLPEQWEETEFVALDRDSELACIAAKVPYRIAPNPDVVEANNYKEILRYGKVLLGEEDWEKKVLQFPTLEKSGFVVPSASR